MIKIKFHYYLFTYCYLLL